MLSRKATRRTTNALTVLCTITAWFCLSNHCVLGSALASSQPAEVGKCPMHSAPAKKKPETKTPCCKDVRAIVAKLLIANPAALRSIGSCEYGENIFRERASVAINVQALDTGPPGCFSFAESVLQESMLSHAPPVS
jgi:hypothetical protein